MVSLLIKASSSSTSAVSASLASVFFSPRLLVGGELRVTPTLVLSLLVRLLHELHNQILDYLLNLLEGVIGHARRKNGEDPTVESLGLVLQISRDADLIRVLRLGPQLRQ